MVNPPLASTAIGVVAPARASMASGINTTFRQVGIATSIAALGSIFATRMAHATPADHVATYAAAPALIRQKDFVVHGPEGAGAGAVEPAAPEALTAPVGAGR